MKQFNLRFKKRLLKIEIEHTPTYIREINKNCYAFEINDVVTIPLHIRGKKPVSNDLKILSFDYICSGYIWRMDVVLGDQNSISFSNIKANKKWNSLSIDVSVYQENFRHSILTKKTSNLYLIILPLHASSAIQFKIRNIRFRPFTHEESLRDSLRASYMKRISASAIDINNYLTSAFPCKISKIIASNEKIIISGTVVAVDISYCIVEIPVFGEFATKEFYETGKIEFDYNCNFTIETERRTNRYGPTYDRIFSRWAIAVTTKDVLALASHCKYASLEHSSKAITPITVKNKKGLGGFKLNRFESDLDELGISFITVNIRLNNFLVSKNSGDAIPFEYNGITYFANRKKIEEYDASLLAAAKRNIVVHAIILVYPEKDSEDKIIGRLLEHPEYDTAGIYTMPNLTRLDAVNQYVAAIDFLAGRYSRQDRLYGHIHRWIVHNEVDSAWIWCNAGRKKDVELMDIYVKSMRLIYLTAFLYNANTEVFISLTHHWRSSFDSKCYFGETMLNLLSMYSRLEGDFRWGVAYHLYPENLLDPKSWLDPNATGDFSTKLITFKNVELLDKWVKHPATFYKGKKQRTLILAEQNPNSFDYSPQALKEQADSLSYILQKVNQFDGIEAYIAHCWIDLREEAGLKTGLRKYIDDSDEPGEKKPAWYVFKNLIQ